MANRLILILCLSLLLIASSSSEIFPPATSDVVVGSNIDSQLTGVNIFVPDPSLNTSTITVNISNIWSTNLGLLDNVNATQFDNNGGTLAIDTTWLERESNESFLRLDGTNSPTQDYSWIIDLEVSGFVNVGAFRSSETSSNVGGIWFTDSSNDVTNDGEFFWDQSNGRLGVLQVSPQFTLDVAGDGKFDGDVIILADIGNSGNLFLGAAQDASIGYNGTDLVYDSQEVGSGDHIFVSGAVKVNTTLNIVETTSANFGVITKNGLRFIHGYAPNEVGSSVFIGEDSGNFVLTGNRNTGLGWHTLRALTSGGNNVGIGFGSGDSVTSGVSNLAIGTFSLPDLNTGGSNIGIGTFAGFEITSGVQNIFIGTNSGVNAGSTSSGNTLIGYLAGVHISNVDSIIGENTVIGHLAFSDFTGTPDGNTIIGQGAGLLVGGDDNIMIGHDAGGQDNSNSNRLYIDNTNTNDPLIYGEFDNDLLRINGKLNVTDELTATDRIVIYDDADFENNISLTADGVSLIEMSFSDATNGLSGLFKLFDGDLFFINLLTGDDDDIVFRTKNIQRIAIKGSGEVIIEDGLEVTNDISVTEKIFVSDSSDFRNNITISAASSSTVELSFANIVDGNHALFKIFNGDFFFINSATDDNDDILFRTKGVQTLAIKGSGEVIAEHDIQVDSDSDSLFVGEGQDASVRYNATDMLIDPRVVGTGDGYLIDDWHVTGDLGIVGNITTEDGSFFSSNVTCTFISSPDGSTVLRVCNA